MWGHLDLLVNPGTNPPSAVREASSPLLFLLCSSSSLLPFPTWLFLSSSSSCFLLPPQRTLLFILSRSFSLSPPSLLFLTPFPSSDAPTPLFLPLLLFFTLPSFRTDSFSQRLFDLHKLWRRHLMADLLQHLLFLLHLLHLHLHLLDLLLLLLLLRQRQQSRRSFHYLRPGPPTQLVWFA